MSVDAFVLPHPGGSYGVIFWEPRRRRTTARGAAGAPDQDVFAVYAPGPLAPGEVAVLQAALHASIGAAIQSGDRRTRARGALLLWWVLGVVAVLLLTARAFEWGPGMAWLVFVAAVFTLPLGRLDGGWPFSGARHALAKRMARYLDTLPEVNGREPRLAERCTALWQFSRNQRGTRREHTAALESFCREHSWPAAARFYRDLLERDDATSGSGGRTQRRQLFLRRPSRRVPYTAVEMGNR